MNAALTYVTFFESVQLLVVFGIGALLMALVITRHLRKKQTREYEHDAEERRYKILESEKRAQLNPPPSRDD